MAGQVHQQFKASLDTKAYEAGLSRMETQTRTSTARTAREFDKIQSSSNRLFNMNGGGGMGRGGKMALAGAVSMQAQDVAVQMQMGASAARILAQQGSQIASFFGPGGMIVGGVIAISAMMWEAAHAGEEAAKQAEKEAKARKEIAAARARENAVSAMERDRDAIEVATIRAEQGNEAADAAERELKFRREIDQIRKNRDAGLLHPRTAELQAGLADARREAEESARNKMEKRERGTERVRAEGQDIIDRGAQIRGELPSKSEARQREREIARSERRAINEEIDREDRKRRNRNITKDSDVDDRRSGLSDREKDEMRAARKGAIDAAKNKNQVTLDQDSIDKILKGIDGLIAK